MLARALLRRRFPVEEILPNRFLNSSKTNWLRFTSLLAADIVNHDIRDLTDPERKNVFIIDDSLFNRTSCNKMTGIKSF